MDRNGYNESLYRTDCCQVCGSHGQLVRHEVYHGSNRQKSKRYGCWVAICVRCHNDIHSNPASYRWLQRETQIRAMERHGWTEQEFRDVFEKSYL